MKIAMTQTQVNGTTRSTLRKLRTFSFKIANQQGHGLKYGKHLRPAEGGKPGRRKRCDCGKQTEKPAKKARQPAAISAETRD
jgi:hypothetical protein